MGAVYSCADHIFRNSLHFLSLFVGVILADYGSSWRDHRRFALMTLRNFGLGKESMEQRINEEIQYIVRTLGKSIGMSSVSELD